MFKNPVMGWVTLSLIAVGAFFLGAVLAFKGSLKWLGDKIAGVKK